MLSPSPTQQKKKKAHVSPRLRRHLASSCWPISGWAVKSCLPQRSVSSLASQRNIHLLLFIHIAPLWKLPFYLSSLLSSKTNYSTWSIDYLTPQIPHVLMLAGLGSDIMHILNGTSCELSWNWIPASDRDAFGCLLWCFICCLCFCKCFFFVVICLF